MAEMTRVVLDTMGGDNSPGEHVLGAVNAVKEKEDLFVYITGPEDKLKEELAKYNYPTDRIEIVNTTEEITCHDQPVNAIRQKKDSSMVVGLKMVKEGKADGFVSSGNSGALLVGGQVLVGKMKGIERAPLAPVVPTMNGVSLLIDCGANVDAKASNLVQFAKMGSIYMENVIGVKNPRVAIVNIGAEEEKGNALVKETFPLLKECKDINFIGSIEARDFPNGVADVVVTEAFVGNVMLKLTEGLAKALVGKVKEGLTSTPISTLGALLVKPALKNTFKFFDTTEHGGAPLLGLNGLVVKIHGNATNKEVKNALFQVETFKKQDINGKIKKYLLEEKENA
ncbi:MAG: phosphate acyltransferase PlsX [Lachnospiraceae bacterium]|nr:phosphate acyltransferase PlsX [Lachnospiraceae bacterium]